MLHWEAIGEYDEAGGRAALESYLQETWALVPREHVRQLDSVRVTDIDPKGMALGVYRQGHEGIWIEIYLAPHIADAWHAPPAARPWALRLSLAHTLFHEVGHHQTLHLNRRTEPPRRKGQVTQTVEKWAEQYVSRRLQKLIDGWTAPGGAASSPEMRAALGLALRFYEKIGRIQLSAAPSP